eukprot:Em0018g432a
MADSKALEEAIELIKKATETDNEQKYEEALPLYSKAIELFLQVYKDKAKNLRLREVIKRKCEQYLERAEAIKQIVSGKQMVSGSDGTAVRVTKEDESAGGGTWKDEKEKPKNTFDVGNVVHGLKPNVKWEDVAGLQQAKEVLMETVILPLKFPQLFNGRRRPLGRGILLYGPPGTGKTYLAKAVATEADSTLFSLETSCLMSPWIGDGERIIRDVFKLARANNPAIIFIDELDSICGARSDCENETTHRHLTELLVQMGADNHGIVVLGATNAPWELNAAVRRRFEKRIYIPLPDEEAKRRVFELNIARVPCNLTAEELNQLAKCTEGYSGVDISIVVREAMMMPIRKVQIATHFKKVLGPKPSDPTEVVDDLYTPCIKIQMQRKCHGWKYQEINCAPSLLL